MNALVTGGTGFIGSHLADELLARGYHVRCLVRNTSKTAWLEGKPFEFVQGTLFDTEVLAKAVEGVDVIFHVAGLTAARTKQEFYQGNAVGTANLLAAAAGSKTLKKFVHVSSETAVGPSTKNHPVDESSPCRPLTSYGHSKLAAEEFVQSYGSALPWTIVRLPAVYGPRDRGVYSFFQTVQMGLLPLIGFDVKELSLCHVRDVVNGLILAAESDKSTGEVFFIGSEKFYTWKEVGAVTKKIMKKRTVQVRIPHWMVMSIAVVSEVLGRFQSKPPILNREKGTDIVQRYWTCSVDKAKHILHYRQTVELAEGIQETVDWYRANGWL